MAGIYASSYGLRQITVQPDRTLALAMYAKGEWKPFIEGLKLARDGRCISDRCPETAYRLVFAGGRRYLAVRSHSAWATMKRNCPTAMTCLLANRSQTVAVADWPRWLAANDPYSAFLALDGNRLCSACWRSRARELYSPLP